MAKYAISEEGIQSLMQMAVKLRQSSEDIDVLSTQFYNFIEGISDGLGVYYKEILEIVRDISKKNKDAKQEVDILANDKIPELVDVMYELWINGLGGGSSDDDDEPPQKKLVLKM